MNQIRVRVLNLTINISPVKCTIPRSLTLYLHSLLHRRIRVPGGKVGKQRCSYSNPALPAWQTSPNNSRNHNDTKTKQKYLKRGANLQAQEGEEAANDSNCIGDDLVDQQSPIQLVRLFLKQMKVPS